MRLNIIKYLIYLKTLKRKRFCVAFKRAVGRCKTVCKAGLTHLGVANRN